MLESLFSPKAVAVIGASMKELHIGNRVVKNLLDGVRGEPGVDKADRVSVVDARASV
jgi:hypothetical protein